MAWFMIWFTCLLLCLKFCYTQLTTNPEHTVYVRENKSGDLLFTGEYISTSPSCTIIEVVIFARADVTIGTTKTTSSSRCQFEITLLRPVDFEKISAFDINVEITRRCDAATIRRESFSRDVFIINVFDVRPTFTKSTYSVSVREDYTVNTAVVGNIKAVDGDMFDRLTFAANFLDNQRNLFQVKVQNDRTMLDIYLISPLDFELMDHKYNFTISVTDTGGLRDTCLVVITVINIQDTPPVFTATRYDDEIYDKAKVGSHVLTVSAKDGDSTGTQDQLGGTSANQISYSIINGDLGMFEINSRTGNITALKEIDIDTNKNIADCLVVMTIMAEELNTSMQPQYGDNRSVVQATVHIKDVNDNSPQFNSQFFTGNIRADAVPGDLITIDGEDNISVSDIDRAPSNNYFSLHIEKDGKPWDVLKPNIEAAHEYTSVMIQLNNNKSILNFEGSNITFQIVAEGYKNSSQNSSRTESQMTVLVKALTSATSPTSPTDTKAATTSYSIVLVIGLLLLIIV